MQKKNRGKLKKKRQKKEGKLEKIQKKKRKREMHCGLLL